MTDYMATPHEQAKQPDAQPFIQEAANGDVAVYNAMWSFWNFAHVFDDLIDGSNWPADKKEQAFKALHDFVVDLLLNPFVQRNALEMRAMFVSALTRCLDGDRLAEHPDERQRVLAPALRCADIDVLMHMAYLHRGWEVMRSYSGKREYDV